MKRCFDLVCALTGLALVSPVLIIVTVIIKAGSSGSIFYRGVRAGLGGKPFSMLKFRTMVADADKIGGPSTSGDDPRITPIGRWMRAYKIDEIPQLINVVRGEMSIVGPRPEVLSEVERYDERQKRLLQVRPGITDFASIRFRNEGEILRGAADPHEAYLRLIQPEKTRLGLQYVEQSSLLVDLKIIFMTVRAVILG